MGEINNNTEKAAWTKYSAEIASALSNKMQKINNILTNDALSADSDIYVKLHNLESGISELFDLLTNKT
jgi:hypothetical protein